MRIWPFGPRRGSTVAISRRHEAAADDALRFREDKIRGRRDDGTKYTDRDLTDVERQRAIRLSRRNYKRSGMYGSMVDQTLCHVLGDGVQVQFEDEKVEEYVLEQLDHPRNAFLTTLDERVRRWILDGESVLTIVSPVRTGSVPTGDVVIGALDPEAITGLEHDTWNDDRITGLRLQIQERGPNETPSEPWIPIAEPEQLGVMRPKYVRGPDGKWGELAGEFGRPMVWCLYWRLNGVGTRGVPLFCRSIDKVTLIDQLVDHLIAKAEYTNRFWHHVTYKKGTTGFDSDVKFEEQVKKVLDDGAPGDYLITSEDVKWEVKAPKLEMGDHEALYRVATGYIRASHNVPQHWFGENQGDKGAAAEAGSPIYRLLRWVQQRLARELEALVRFLVWLGKASGRIPAGANEEFTVAMAEFATRDSIRDVQELTWLSTALDSFVATGVISEEERQKLGRRVLGGKPYGGELEETAPDLDALEKERQERAAAEMPLHRDGNGEEEPDPDAKAPQQGEKPGKAASPPGR